VRVRTDDQACAFKWVVWYIFGVFLVTQVKPEKKASYEGFVHMRISQLVSYIDSVHVLG
jgi:hypothetical protein